MKAHVEKWKKVGEKRGKAIYQPELVSVIENHKVQLGDSVKDIKVKCTRRWDGKTDYEPDQPPVEGVAKSLITDA